MDATQELRIGRYIFQHCFPRITAEIETGLTELVTLLRKTEQRTGAHFHSNIEVAPVHQPFDEIRVALAHDNKLVVSENFVMKRGSSPAEQEWWLAHEASHAVHEDVNAAIAILPYADIGHNALHALQTIQPSQQTALANNIVKKIGNIDKYQRTVAHAGEYIAQLDQHFAPLRAALPATAKHDGISLLKQYQASPQLEHLIKTVPTPTENQMDAIALLEELTKTPATTHSDTYVNDTVAQQISSISQQLPARKLSYNNLSQAHNHALEHRADLFACAHSDTPQAMVGALEKITAEHEHIASGAHDTITHPHPKRRISLCREVLDWPGLMLNANTITLESRHVLSDMTRTWATRIQPATPKGPLIL